MRTRIDEATVRRMVRSSIVRRILSEADEVDPNVPTFNIGSVVSAITGGTVSSGSSSAASSPPGTFTSGRKRGQSAADAIASVVGGKSDRDETGSPIVGEELGASIKKFIDGMDYVKAPFKVGEPSNALQEWNEAVAQGSVPELTEIGPDGKPTETKMEAEAGEEGLLRYLIALKGAETGLQVTLRSIERMEGDYQRNLAPLVEQFVSAINGYTTIEDLETIASETAKVVRDDKTPQLIRAKVLLAGFSRDNSTTYELLKPIGVALAVVGAAVAVYFTGGAALAAAPYFAGFAGFTGLTAFAGWSALTLAGAASTVWGLTQAFQSAINNYMQGPVGDMLNAVNQPGGADFLSELSVEVSRTSFPIDNTAAYRRDQIAKGLREIASSKPNKAKILEYLEGN